MSLLVAHLPVSATFNTCFVHNLLSKSFVSSHDILVLGPVIRLPLTIMENYVACSTAVDFTVVDDLQVDAVLGVWRLEWHMSNGGMH